ncbi:TPA: hypothetical protein PBP97_004458 [Escherichia coli]|nr:hypothetical protein [Escherichia coli]
MSRNLKAEIHGRVKKRMKVFAQYMLLLTGITVFSLWLADTGMRHAEGFAALREWMYKTRYGWLGWRLCLYSVIGWLGWRSWHAPGFRAEYRASFLRMSTASILFVLLCEYTIWAEPGR